MKRTSVLQISNGFSLIMILVICSSLCLANFAWATNVDPNYLKQLNTSAIETEKLLNNCALDQNLSTSATYLNQGRCNSKELISAMQRLKANIKMFAVSSFDGADLAKSSGDRVQASPLLIQLILEEMSDLALDKTEVSGGNSGFGLCTGIINIGVCKSETKTLTAVQISETGKRFLRLLDSFEMQDCQFSYFPNQAAKMISEIANAQSNQSENGYSTYKSKSGRTFIGSAELIRALKAADGVVENTTSLEAYKIAQEKFVSLAMNCSIKLERESGISFFQKLKAQNRLD